MVRLYDDFSEYESFFICGDIHGEFKTLLYELKRKEISNAVILLAGDCGIGFEKPEHYNQLYQRIRKTLAKMNCLLLMIGGNHDDPVYFQKSLIDFPLMKSLPDYSVLRFKNQHILCVGGGVSVDRSDRLQAMWLAELKKKKPAPKYYWEDEMPVFDKVALSALKPEEISIDVVITHSAPSFCAPTTKTGIESWLERDEELEQDIVKERKVMDKIYNYLSKEKHPVKYWFYGHFHFSHTEYISDIRFQLLNIMELYMLQQDLR